MPTLPVPAIPTSLTTSIDFLPFAQKQYELYPKIGQMLDYIMSKAVVELEDVKYKYSRPDAVSSEVIKQIVQELGYQYIRDVMDTLENFEFTALLDFLSLISLLKGSRQGLELILKLLGFDSIIKEWWEIDPVRPVYTYELIIIMDTTFVPDIFGTLDKIKIFARQYVYPTLSNIDFRFNLSFAQKNVNFAGFWRLHYGGRIAQRVPPA